MNRTDLAFLIAGVIDTAVLAGFIYVVLMRAFV